MGRISHKDTGSQRAAHIDHRVSRKLECSIRNRAILPKKLLNVASRRDKVVGQNAPVAPEMVVSIYRAVLASSAR